LTKRKLNTFWNGRWNVARLDKRLAELVLLNFCHRLKSLNKNLHSLLIRNAVVLTPLMQLFDVFFFGLGLYSFFENK
jgi:hypothetical protein